MCMGKDETGDCDKSAGTGAFRRFVIVSMSVGFVLMAATGIVKFPELKRYFVFVYDFMPASTISFIHNWSGIVSVVLVIIHMLMKWRGLKAAFIGAPGSVLKGRDLMLGAVLILGGALYLNAKHSGGDKKPVTLPAVEVKEYKGEKLGTRGDFRENSINGPQHVEKNGYELHIFGLAGAPARYSYDDIFKLPAFQKVVTIDCVEGWSVKILWEGALVKDLLKKVKIKPEAKTIIFYAADGYSTSFPLDYVLKNDIILAGKMNGMVLTPERGFPFQLVAENKWGYKWIKWITKIELSGDTNYKGFWEKRGYNNNGDLNGPKFEQ